MHHECPGSARSPRLVKSASASERGKKLLGKRPLRDSDLGLSRQPECPSPVSRFSTEPGAVTTLHLTELSDSSFFVLVKSNFRQNAINPRSAQTGFTAHSY